MCDAIKLHESNHETTQYKNNRRYGKKEYKNNRMSQFICLLFLMMIKKLAGGADIQTLAVVGALTNRLRVFFQMYTDKVQ